MRPKKQRDRCSWPHSLRKLLAFRLARRRRACTSFSFAVVMFASLLLRRQLNGRTVPLSPFRCINHRSERQASANKSRHHQGQCTFHSHTSNYCSGEQPREPPFPSLLNTPAERLLKKERTSFLQRDLTSDQGLWSNGWRKTERRASVVAAYGIFWRGNQSVRRDMTRRIPTLLSLTKKLRHRRHKRFRLFVWRHVSSLFDEREFGLRNCFFPVVSVDRQY